MRWYILRTLIVKEALRHLADRGGIILALLLVSVAMLLSIFGKDDAQGGLLGETAQKCYVHYSDYNPWVAHLLRAPAPGLKLEFGKIEHQPTDTNGLIAYPRSAVAIQIRQIPVAPTSAALAPAELGGKGSDPLRQGVRPLSPSSPGERGRDAGGGASRQRFVVMFWYPGKDPSVLAPFSNWFWKESQRFFQDATVQIETAEEQFPCPAGFSAIQIRPVERAGESKPLRQIILSRADATAKVPTPRYEIEEQRLPLRGSSDERSKMAAVLVMFPLFLFCAYLLPAFTCEEHERGILLAQALSPASPQEILTAKFLFYPVIAMGLAAVLAGIYRPAVLLLPFFWLSLFATALGYLGVGMTISSLARTQRAASMGALTYLLTVTLFLYVTERFGIPSVQFLELEYYCPRIAQAALEGVIAPWHWLNLAAALVLAFLWTYVATVLFRKRGWQ